MVQSLRAVRLLALAGLGLLCSTLSIALAAESYDPPKMVISGSTDAYVLSVTPEDMLYRDMGDTSGYYSTDLQILFSQSNATQVITPWNNPTPLSCTIPISFIPRATGEAGGKTTDSPNSDDCKFTVWSTYDDTRRLPTFHIKLGRAGLTNYYVSARLRDAAGRFSEAAMFLRLGSETKTLPLPRLTMGKNRQFVLSNVDQGTTALRIAITKDSKAHARDGFLRRLAVVPSEFVVCDVNFKTSTDPILPCNFILDSYAFSTDPKDGFIAFRLREFPSMKNIAMAPISSTGQVGTYSHPLVVPGVQGFTTDEFIAAHFTYLGDNTIRLYHSGEIQTYEMLIDAPGNTPIHPRDINIGLDRGVFTPVKICRIAASELVIGGTLTDTTCTKEITKVPNSTDVYTIKVNYNGYNLDDYAFGLKPIAKNGFVNTFVGPFLTGSVMKDFAVSTVENTPTGSVTPPTTPTTTAPTAPNPMATSLTTPQLSWTKDESMVVVKPGKGLTAQKLLFSTPVRTFSTNTFDGLSQSERENITCYLSETLSTGIGIELISSMPNEPKRSPCLLNISDQGEGTYAIELAEKHLAFRYITVEYTLPNGTKSFVTPIMTARSGELLPTLNYMEPKEALGYVNFTDTALVSTPYAQAVLTLQELRMMSGYPDGSFRPQNPINRAEFTKILLLSRYTDEQIRRETAHQMANPCFKDVSPYEWYIPYVCFAQKYGIIEGYGDGTFRPANSITYSEALKISLVTNGFEGSTGEGAMSHWFSPYEITGKALGVFTQLIFQPFSPINREQASEMIYRVYAAKEYFEGF